MIYKVGGAESIKEDEAINLFEDMYTEAVHNKTMVNEILLDNEYDSKAAMVTPSCVKRGSFWEFIN